jgi:16S rRNA (cytosine1402-N4)-methyltransferase
MNPAGQRHIPVLGRQAVGMLQPRAGGIYVDATFGAGGYSRTILDTAGTRVIGIDRDRSAVAAGFDLVDRSDGRLTLVEDRFSNLAEICAAQGVEAADGVVMDVGVSSMQLDEAERGFSFRLGGPLDMRMGHAGPTAADVIAKASEADLANIIYIFGEERHSRSLARAIVAARRQAPITTTRALADIVAKVVRSKPGEIHPATRRFGSEFRQRGTRRAASGAFGGRALAEAGWPAGGGIVSFAGRPHRQEFPGRASQGRRRIAASAGHRAGRAELSHPDQASGHAR